MCTHIRKITNKYTGKTLYVKCGVCPSCQMEKAKKRASMIRYATTSKDDVQSIFFHLTYDDNCVPYFQIQDLNHVSSKSDSNVVNPSLKVPVYRNCKVYQYFSKADRKIITKYVYGRFLIGYKIMKNYNPNIDKLHSLTSKYDSPYRSFNDIGCIFSQDIQNFFKRLRTNISRHVDLPKDELQFKYFVASEYGSKSERPHFHVLLTVKNAVKNLPVWKRQICKAWLFADSSRTREFIEIAINPATYISLYVNKLDDVSPFLKTGQIKPRAFHSQLYCVDSKYFQFDTILSKIEQRDLYFTREVFQKGQSCGKFSFPIPRYILRYYFPNFRGFSNLSDQEQDSILQGLSFDEYACYAKKMKLFFPKTHFIDWSLVKKSFNYIVKKVRTFVDKYSIDFCYYFSRLRSALRKSLFLEHFEPLLEHVYYNLSDLVEKSGLCTSLEVDFNKFPQNLIPDLELTETFYNYSRYISDNQKTMYYFNNDF